MDPVCAQWMVRGEVVHNAMFYRNVGVLKSPDK